MRSLSEVTAALGLAVVLASAAPPRAAPPGGVLGCVRLALGPAVDTAAAPVRAPAALALRMGGHVAAAATPTDTPAPPASPAFTRWAQPSRDSLLVRWHPGRLGGSLYLRLARRENAWRGRYAMSGHTGGAGLWRGDALAVPVPCMRTGAGADSLAQVVETRVARWQAAGRPDTARAVTEELADFRQFVRETPIHTLSIVNYRIATFACEHGRLPATLHELRPPRDSLRGPVGPLVAAELVDAWGHAPRYRPRRPGYEVRSAGPDGKFDTPDDLVSKLDAPLRRDRADGCQ